MKNQPNFDVSGPAIEFEGMHTILKFDVAHFFRLCYDASLLLCYVISLVLIVAFGAYGMEMLSAAL